MPNNTTVLPGFKITAKSHTDKNTAAGATSMLPEQFAARISDFIRTWLVNNKETEVTLSIENWDETFDLEESTYHIHADDLTSEQINDYTRNYWIETK